MNSGTCRKVADGLRVSAQNATNAAARDAMIRAACSRAYYSVYYKAREWAVANNYVKGPDNSFHKDLWDWFNKFTGIRDVKGSGQELHEARVAADYTRTDLLTQTFLDEFFDDADYCCQLLDELATELDRRQAQFRS